MNELIFLVEEAPEGGYTARAVGHSIFTEADTLDELRAHIREVVECHFDAGEAPEAVLINGAVRREILSGLADSEARRVLPLSEVRARFGLPQ